MERHGRFVPTTADVSKAKNSKNSATAENIEKIWCESNSHIGTGLVERTMRTINSLI